MLHMKQGYTYSILPYTFIIHGEYCKPEQHRSILHCVDLLCSLSQFGNAAEIVNTLFQTAANVEVAFQNNVIHTLISHIPEEHSFLLLMHVLLTLCDIHDFVEDDECLCNHSFLECLCRDYEYVEALNMNIYV